MKKSVKASVKRSVKKVGEPDYDARRKQDMVDYGCYGRQAEIMRDMKEYH